MLNHPHCLDSETIEAISSFFNRILVQIKGSWIFFQLLTLNTFNNFLTAHRKELRYLSLVTSITKILTAFFSKCKENPLLALEIIMPFPNCETKDKILINYEYDEYRERNYEEDDEEEEGDFEEFLEKVKEKGLTDDEKIKILEYYEVFKDDMKN